MASAHSRAGPPNRTLKTSSPCSQAGNSFGGERPAPSTALSTRVLKLTSEKPCCRSLKRPADSHPARHSSFRLLEAKQDMGCAASTERQVDTAAFQSLRELQGVLRWSGIRSTNLILGWNGKQSFGGRSLHFLDPEGLILNPYQIVINIIGRTLLPRKSKKPIHVFGFGDARTADRCVFTFLPDGKACRDVHHVLRRYKEIIPELVLGGPTNFAPIIYHAIRQVKVTGACHILVIIADGQVTNEKETSQAIVEASKYALSIIVVGVGDGPWEEMEHYGAMLPKRKFENFHFVNLGQVMADNFEQPALGFATAALAHIPDQLAAIRRLGLLHEGHSDTNSQKTTASKHE